MTNYEIIRNEAINNGIYSEEEIEQMEANMEGVPLHTFAFWKMCGYSVRKGEKACVTTYLWRFKKAKKKDLEEAVEIDPETDPAHYYKAKAFLFHRGQVDYVGV